jgi:hypothetical protein
MTNVENENLFRRHIDRSDVGNTIDNRGHASGFRAESTRGGCLITG